MRVHDPGEVVLLRLARPSAEELAAFDDTYDVSGDRQIPVEEILRRLQAFEDDQARRLDHYQATRTLHLRFQGLAGRLRSARTRASFSTASMKAGSTGCGRNSLVGGVKWRSKRLPKVPLIQPEKVASLPAEIRLTKDYDYRLRGTATDRWSRLLGHRFQTGRSRSPAGASIEAPCGSTARSSPASAPGRHRSGLEGSVLSNEETYFFTPVDETGDDRPRGREKALCCRLRIYRATDAVGSQRHPAGGDRDRPGECAHQWCRFRRQSGGRPCVRGHDGAGHRRGAPLPAQG